MLITTVNIQAAALPRATALMQWLDSRDDHIFVLTETSAGDGTGHLLERCRQAGWSVLSNGAAPGDRGCAIVSRLPLTPLVNLTSSLSLPGRAVACSVDADPSVTVFGIYVPSSDRSPDKVGKKRDFLNSVVASLKDMPSQQRAGLVLCGDYNVITRDHDPAYRGTFLSWEYAFMDTLTSDLGLVDAYRHLHAQQAHSWHGRSGNPYCFDYIHLGSALVPRLTAATYDHRPRTEQLTDHAAVSAHLDVEVKHLPYETTSPLAAGTLF
ncbi:endonuclease/exonuclease/phosphatase family protein [Catellatospora methionotrophica]|uniref:endonuclease/exonuclease/phosphatase family protein n=1 Tax=Catellatospora methionotrophica TaxID=121620 RepID=UPI0033FFDD74